MKKCLCILALGLLASPAFGFEINAGISGSWYNPNRDGHGFAVEFTENENACEQINDQGCLVVYWFAYDKDRHPIFLLGVLPVDGNVAEGELLYFSGQEFGSFAPVPMSQSWGTLTLRFTNCNEGFASYESGFMPPDGGAAFDEEGNFKIARLAFVSNIGCEKADRIANTPVRAASGYYVGRALSRDFDDDEFIDSASAFAIIRDNGEAFFIWPGPSLFYGELSGEGMALEGEFTAISAFPTTLENGETTGSVTIKTASKATLELIQSTPRTGEGRPGDFIEGTWKGVGPDGDFSMRFQRESNRPPEISRGARCWQWVANNGQTAVPSRLHADGSFEFELNRGCKVTGRIEPAGETWNVFAASADLTDAESDTCDFKGSYEGVFSIVERSDAEPGNDKQMIFALHDGTNSLVGLVNSLADSQCDAGNESK